MFYYKRIDEKNNPFILKESFKEDFPTRNKYIQINKNEFDYLLNELKLPLENWSFYQFNNLVDLGIFCYNIIYPNLIKDLIAYCELKPYWVKIEELTAVETSVEDYSKKNFSFHNEYLNWTKTKGIESLGYDILEKGMFFPFFGDEYHSNNRVGYGSHRVLSLQWINKSSKINKKFLYISYPHICELTNYRFNEYHNLGIINKKIKVPLFDKENYRVYLIETDSFEIIWNSFTQFSDEFGNYLYHIKDYISPNPIFNDEKLFMEFINNNE